MPKMTNSDDFGVLWLSNLLEAAFANRLIVEERSWKRLPDGPKEIVSFEMARRGLRPEWITSRCQLARMYDGEENEEELAIVMVGDGQKDSWVCTMIAATDDELVGVLGPSDKHNVRVDWGNSRNPESDQDQCSAEL